MKKVITLLISFYILSVLHCFGQTTVTNLGSELTIGNGGIYISGSYVNGTSPKAKIANGGIIHIKKDLINNASHHLFDTKSGKVVFNGSSDQKVSGDTSIYFYQLENNKGGGQLILAQNIVVRNALTLSQGNIFLNGKNIDLDSSGYLVGESNYKRVYGDSGLIKIRKHIRQTKLAENISGLGIYISTSDNFGNAVIERGHSKQYFGGDSSVQRYYNFYPTNTAKIDTVRLAYLNGEAVPNKTFYKIFTSLDEGKGWKNKGGFVDTLRGFAQSTSVSPPDIKKAKFTIFPTQNFATCQPNDPNYISAVFLVSTTVAAGDSIKFVQLSSPDAVSFLWNFGDGNSSSEFSPFYNYISTDTSTTLYNVTMTVTNGICSDTRKKVIEISPKLKNQRNEILYMGIESAALYPNPTTGLVTLQIAASNEADIHIEIFNSQGIGLYEITEKSDTFKEQLNLNYLAAGVYYVKFKVAEDVRVLKMVKI